MELLHNPIRTYSWGSRRVLAEMQGRPAPTETPEAELWMGAHPDSPSTLIWQGRRRGLDSVLASSPELLGSDDVARYGARLPFLLKALAADSPLSLQAHPNPEMAARRYAEEADLPVGDRLYTDPYAKPELLVATGAFDALCGFRDPSISADLLASLRIAALTPVVTMLRTGAPESQLDAGPPESRLRSAVETLLRWHRGDSAGIVAEVVTASRRCGLDYIAELGERFPGDMGVVVALLCNRVELDEGEGIWMPAGNLHAYLRGTGIEALASSDNVLRGGLTAKRVDVDELLRVLTFQVLPDPVVKPVGLGRGLDTWPVPAPDFALFRCRIGALDGPVEVPVTGPRIAFCQRGAVIVNDGSELALRAGQAAFGGAGRRLAVRGDGVAFVASTGG
jgi:mannose-6-phosphate isomerase